MEPRHSYQFKGERRSADKLAGLIVCRQVLLSRISMRAADSVAAEKVVTGKKKKNSWEEMAEHPRLKTFVWLMSHRGEKMK